MKIAQRDVNTARALAVRFGHRPLSQTHRQDRLQYTAPQLASAQCKYTSCARGDTICPTPPAVRTLRPTSIHSLPALRLRHPARLAPGIFMIDRQRLALGGGVDCRYTLLCSDLNSQPKRPGDLDLWPFVPESGVRVTCDVGYLCVNFGLPRPLCCRLRPDVRDRRQATSSLNAPAY